ncbi:Succinate dehydrogenase subunit 5, mitochondrial [Ananas comosus]|uniref:Succinate dehydrogenase subunit 5, mitochondrial n=1 Tax=Ananas comosus TaxID=4615 RepID=A0A199VIC0_ANACO|nr:Succinate dehydrogenase subunit 5, mitochondrial [Ananas comosus]
MATMLRSSSSSSLVRRLMTLSRASYSLIATAASASHSNAVARSPFSRPSPSIARPISDYNYPFPWGFKRLFSSNPSHLPTIADPDIEVAFKDLLAMSWDEIPDSVLEEAKKALSKNTDDKAGQEALKNVLRAAEACVEFGGVLVSLRMALDDLCGLSGENVGPLPGYIEDAVKAAYKRYMTYLDSFGPDELYLRKKVETELGTKMIHLKMRCSGIGSEWGKLKAVSTSTLWAKEGRR